MKVVALSAICAAFACAESWSGRLLDATCIDQQKSSCDPTSATVAFAINVSGKLYKLDDSGNAKAVAALKARNESAKDPNQSASAGAAITAKVNGVMEGEVVKVESIQLQ
jgi:hypothetical protein